MAQDMIISILVYFCIFENPNTATFSLGDGSRTQENSFASQNCQNCGGGKEERKIRREIGGIPVRDAKSKYLKAPSEGIQEHNRPRKPTSVNSLPLKSWGARGMPFNVLYTPNAHQQKMMKYVRHKQEERKPAKEKGKNVPLIYNLVLEDKKTAKGRGHILKKHTVPRKYYSLIPQLFVSYGW